MHSFVNHESLTQQDLHHFAARAHTEFEQLITKHCSGPCQLVLQPGDTLLKASTHNAVKLCAEFCCREDEVQAAAHQALQHTLASDGVTKQSPRQCLQQQYYWLAPTTALSSAGPFCCKGLQKMKYNQQLTKQCST